jgi:uncharacterized protein (UPF0548 family)
MIGGRTIGPWDVRRRLAALPAKPLNFDPASLAQASSADGWHRTDLCQELPGEAPGDPVPEGSWETARRLMSGYEFADPSIVQAYYDEHLPLEGRNMLLKLKALGLVHVLVGVRVGEVYERTLQIDGRPVRVWGWSYRTLEGHVEAGQMDWEVWKWLEDGRVQFRVHAVSRPAPVFNPLVAVGFRLLRGHERKAFLQSTRARMRHLTEHALAQDASPASLRAAARQATARADGEADGAHERLARRMERS